MIIIVLVFILCRCSCDCNLGIDTQNEQQDDSDQDYKLYAYLDGLSDDQIAYVAQSADHREGVIVMAKNRTSDSEVCRAGILRRNFSHTDTKLYIAFDEANTTKLMQRFKDLRKQNCTIPVHIKFDLKNSYFHNLSQSVRRIPSSIVNRIMPDINSLCQFEHPNLSLYLPKGSFSEDQLQALDMIVSSSRDGPPSLITGPFGTGKSHVLAASAYWLFRRSLDIEDPSRILVCTQQRESADNFFLLYQGIMSKERDATVFIVREYGHNRKLKRWTKSVDQFKRYMSMKADQDSKGIENFLIIMPCLTALRVQKANFLPLDFFTHIFIDEGAQMREPEALAPLSMASANTKIVIAGDPWQVYKLMCQCMTMSCNYM